MRSQLLPSKGVWVLGRSSQCEVQIDDPMLSRRHVALHLGEQLELEDLGSANGTFTRSSQHGGARARLASGQRVALAVGEFVELGTTQLLLWPRSVSPPGFHEGAAGPKSPLLSGTPMERLGELVRRVSIGDISVLLLGETGVGKEVFAERIHKLSPRAQRPFLKLNCAALSESLLESELFGHEKGAFTGAVQAKPGLLETAEGGTVFLDEAGELPASLQVKLLRVLEERAVLRVGALKPRQIDVRFVSATNRDLQAEIARGTFRRDLYYRLNGVTIQIPPLRERLEEVEGLARAFAEQSWRKLGRSAAPTLAPSALAALRAHPWPGNIRELRNVVERAVLLCPGEELTEEHLALSPAPASVASADAPSVAAAPTTSKPAREEGGSSPEERSSPEALRGDVHRFERERILAALRECDGNQTRAAKLLGISRRTLVSRLTSYGLTRARR